MGKLKNFIGSAALSASITVGGMLIPGCSDENIGPQIDFGENTEQVKQQMTEQDALISAISDYIKNEKLLEKLVDVPVKNYKRREFSNEEKQITARLKEVIKQGFSKDIVSKEMPFTAETFNKRCDQLNFHFGNFVDLNNNIGFITYPDISVAIAIDGNKIDNEWSISKTIIHEIGHALGIQLESMTELFEEIYTGHEQINAPTLKSGNKQGDRTGLTNKYNTRIERALKNKVGVKECFRAALTSPKAVKDLWNKNMNDIMNYDKIKKLNDNIETDAITTKAFNNLNIKDPNFTEGKFANDGNALLSKVLGLSEYNRNDPNTPGSFLSELFPIDNHDIKYSSKVFAFDNPLLQDIPLKNKESLNRGGFLVTSDLTNDYCKEGLNRYANLFNILTKSAESTTNSDIISNPAPPIELDR